MPMEDREMAVGLQILNQPYDVSTTVGLTAAFAYLVADAAGTITYQWLTNNHRIALLSGFVPQSGAEIDGMWPIVGATSASYTTPALVALDNGSQFICEVTDVESTALMIAQAASVEKISSFYSSRCAVLLVH